MRRRLRGTGCWKQWANEFVFTLNSLVGAHASTEAPTSLQKGVLEHVATACQRMGKPPEGLTPAGAFFELGGSKLPYLGEGVGPVPYDRDLVALPSGSAPPISTMEHLPARHRERVTGVYAAMLNPPSVAEQLLEADGLSVPYIDPAFRSGAVYGAFLRDLLGHSWGCSSWGRKTAASGSSSTRGSPTRISRTHRIQPCPARGMGSARAPARTADIFFRRRHRVRFLQDGGT